MDNPIRAGWACSDMHRTLEALDRMGRFIWEYLDGPKWGRALHQAYWETRAHMDAVEASDDRRRRKLMHPRG